MQSRLRLTGRRFVAALSGGSLAGFVAIHAVHLAVGAGAPIAIQFICHIAR